MEVRFRTNKLRKCYEQRKEAVKAFGPEVAKRYVMRVNIIKRSHDLEELQQQRTLRCHALKHDRKGQYAISLTGFYRLIFTLEGDSLSIVRIEEVSKHYED